MKKKIILINLLLCYCVNGQELVNRFNLNLDKKTNSFHVLENITNTTGLFFIDKEKIKCLKLDEQLHINDSITTFKLDKEYKKLIGNSALNNNFFLYWMNNKEKSIVAQIFDFNNKRVTTQTFVVDFKNEQIVNKLTINGKFHIITLNKNSSIVNIYSFEGSLAKKTLSFENKKFLNSIDKPCNLSHLFNESLGVQNGPIVQNILTETPPSLIFSSSKKKCFINNNEVVFSFDNNNSFTQTVSINFENFETKQVIYTKPYLKENDFNFVDSNSFIIDNKIVQIKLNYDKMSVVVKSLENQELKSFEIKDDENINFANTDIIQENSSIDNKRVLDKSNKLLRKINNNHPSVSLYKENGNYLMTLGGVSDVKNNNAIFYGGMIGGFTGALVGVLLTNYSLENIYSYNNRKVVYINSLFDSNFNHIPSQLKETPFDNLRQFVTHTTLDFQVSYKLKNNLIFGGFDKKTNEYKFYKF